MKDFYSVLEIAASISRPVFKPKPGVHYAIFRDEDEGGAPAAPRLVKIVRQPDNVYSEVQTLARAVTLTNGSYGFPAIVLAALAADAD